MKKRTSLLCFLLFCWCNLSFSAPISDLLPVKHLTLQECLKLAEEANEKLAIAQFHIDAAEASKREGRAPLLPQLNIDGRYEQKNAGRDFSVFNDFGGAFSSIGFGSSLSALLFDFGSSWKNYQAGDALLSSAQWEQKKVLQNVQEEVKVAYFQVLESKRSIEVVRHSIKTLQHQLHCTKDFFSEGLVAHADVLAVEVQLAERNKSLLRAENEWIRSSMHLNKLLGFDLLSPLELEEVPSLSSREVSFEDARIFALAHRPDLVALQEQISAMRLRYEGVRRSFFPKFSAFSGYNYLHDPIQKGHHWISGGVGMQFSLYDGGRRSAQADRLHAQMEELDAHLRDGKVSIALEINQALFQLRELEETLSIDRTTIGLAEETLQSVVDRYSEGLVSIYDLLRAEEQRSAMEMNYNRTLYRYHMAQAHLITVMGGCL